MFNYFSYLSSEYEFLSFFRLFDSVLFRSIGAMITALVFSLIFGKFLIDMLYKKGMRDVVREYGLIGTGDKKGTPTMGGILIILTLLITIFLWSDLLSIYTIFSIISLIWFGALGAYDDVMKVKYKNSDKGISQLTKIILQGIFALSIALYFYYDSTSPFPDSIRTCLNVPFLKNNINFDLGIFYIPFAAFTVLAISNAVNFADGMDGLAIVPSISTGIVYGVFAYIISNVKYSDYLLFTYVAGMEELTIIMAALFGAGLGFLWFNCYPATLFMGDTGSMAIGGLLSVVVLSTKQELIFLIAGGIFVAEAFSVLVQQKIGINRLGKRIFFRAPLHDSFKYRGYPEIKIVIRFWIISIILVLISIASIKVR